MIPYCYNFARYLNLRSSISILKSSDINSLRFISELIIILIYQGNQILKHRDLLVNNITFRHIQRLSHLLIYKALALIHWLETIPISKIDFLFLFRVDKHRAALVQIEILLRINVTAGRQFGLVIWCCNIVFCKRLHVCFVVHLSLNCWVV